MISDAQKKARDKWDRNNTKIASCKLKIPEYEAFKTFAESQNKTVSGMLLEYVRSCINTETQD